jgi:hypothetical protein
MIFRQWVPSVEDLVRILSTIHTVTLYSVAVAVFLLQ